MRAAIIRGGNLEVVERDTPQPGGSHVLVEVAAAGLNRADLLQKMGAYPAPPGWPADIPGLEFAGRVAARGEQAQAFDVGDEVFGITGAGGHATHVLVPEELCVPVPRGLDLTKAGGAPEIFVTAHDALVSHANTRPGERVLVHGVGSGVGTAVVQLARALGAETVGTSRTQSKLDRARELGLDAGVLAGDGMDSAIGEVDVVVDLVGGDYLTTDVQVCRPKGRIVIVGLLAGASAPLDMGLVLRKRLTVKGTTLRARDNPEKALAVQAFGREVAPGLGAGAFQVVVERVWPLEDVAAAYDFMASNEGFGKIILKMSA